MKHALVVIVTLVVLVSALSTGNVSPVAALSGSDFKAGRIIDDGVFNYNSSMSIAQIQQFLDSKMPNCDRWGTQSYADTTRRAYGESRGVIFPLTCLNSYYENTSTKVNNLEGRGIPEGAKSAANIIYDAAQQYSINPQVIIVLLQKEQNLILDDWPYPIQYRSATGYGCPDTAPCNAEYYGFYNQVNNAARQFRRYATYPNDYNYSTGTNYIQWNPQSSCGGNTVQIESQSTASLYNYTPYQPNQAALNNLYGSGDSCSAYGNRNFWRLFSDWFGSTNIFDPYGWQVIKTLTDSREYLVVGNTKRWIPSGSIYSDWNLGLKPAVTVSQSYLDSIPTLPALGRLGYFNNKFYLIDGGKKYGLTNDDLLRAWGEINNKALAVPAYIPLSTLPDGGEAAYFVSLPSQNKVGRLINGQLYSINPSDLERWKGNPQVLTAAAYNNLPMGPALDYHVSVNGTKYIVDDGRFLNVSSSSLLRDYSQTNATFVNLPNEILSFYNTQTASPLIKINGIEAWYVLRGGVMYYIPSADYALAWNINGSPTTLTAKFTQGYTRSGSFLPLIIQDQTNSQRYILDGSRHGLSGVLSNAVQASGMSLPLFDTSYINEIPQGLNLSSPLVQTSERGDIFNVINGKLYHIPSGDILSAVGYPQVYGLSKVSQKFTNALGIAGAVNVLIRDNGQTYLLQDGRYYLIDSNVLTEWTTNNSVFDYPGNDFQSRFTSGSTTPINQFFKDNNTNALISDGRVYRLDSTYDSSARSWSNITTKGISQAGNASYLVRSSDLSDSRIWLIKGSTKQHIVSPSNYLAYTKNNFVPISILSSSTLNTFTQINPGKDASPLLYLDGNGFKLLNEDGSFYSFDSGTVLANFATSNLTQNVSTSTFQAYSQHVRPVTRLISDPSGTIYWVENGTKRWVSNSTAYNRYAPYNIITNVSWNVINWLPSGSLISQ